MTELLTELNERIKTLGGDWTKYTAIGGFLLYVSGYLAIRFHLGAVGAGTDLNIVDERYLFAGARFLVYLIADLLNITLAALLIILPVRIVLRFFPSTIKTSISLWFMNQRRLVLFGIIFSIFMIQCVMRQCFFLNNLLLSPDISNTPGWIFNLLIYYEYITLYFCLLVAGCVVSLAVLLIVHKINISNEANVLPKRLLTLLVAVQILLLPINYGILILDKTLPRVSALGETPLTQGESAWLVWEGNNGITFLVRYPEPKHHALVTLPRSEIKRIEILGYDHIFPTLFGSQQENKT